MQDLSYCFSDHLPKNVHTLIWEVFFSSRQRGVSLPVHFPWVEQPGSFYSLWIELAGQDQVMAALLMKRFLLRNGKPAAMLGLVCVHPQARGQGLSRELLSAAGLKARELGLEALVLWTQKPGVYERLGYVSVAQEQLWDVSVPAHLVRHLDGSLVSEQIIELESGLPPFALGARRYTWGRAEAVVLQTASGDAVAAWEGKTEDVAQLLLSVLTDRWSLNALPQDDLPDVLMALGCVCHCLPGAHRMLGDCHVRPFGVGEVLSQLPSWRLLQRI